MEDPFWLDGWYIDPVAGSLQREGAEVRLEPKVMTVLLVLVEHAGEIVSREELEKLAWPGVVVGYDALASSIIKLRKALGDDSRQPRFIETVPKRGYRLIASIREGLEGEGPENQPHSEPIVEVRASFKPLYAVIGLGIILAVFIANFLWFSVDNKGGIKQEIPVTQGLPTIAVLPFSNLRDDPDSDYLSDGITEDLIIDLSRYSGLRVIAKRSSFAYKTQTVNLQTLAKKLGARYVVEGSVRHDRGRVRITVQLVDSQSGLNLWADRYDRVIDDLLDVQDEVRQKIIKTLSVALTEEEKSRERRRYTSNFEAYDYFLRGQSSLVKRSGVSDYRQAKDLLEKAVELDPDFARAWSALALAHADAYRFGWTDDNKQVGRMAIEAGQRAIQLDSNLPQAYWVMGYIELYVNHNNEKAVEFGRRCIDLSPSNADGYALLAIANVYLEMPDKAIRLIKEAMRLNPHYPSMYPSVLGQAYLANDDVNNARVAFEESLSINPARLQGNVLMIITLVRLGEIEDAKWQAEQFKVSNPDFSAKDWVAHYAVNDDISKQRMLEDLKKAGF